MAHSGENGFEEVAATGVRQRFARGLVWWVYRMNDSEVDE